MAWLNITTELTKEGRQKLQVGQVLMFDKVHLKIMRKQGGKVWAKKTYLYHPDEVEITDTKKIDKV